MLECQKYYNMTKFGIEGLNGMGVELASKISSQYGRTNFCWTQCKKFFKNKKFKRLALNNIPMGKVASSPMWLRSLFFASDAAA